MELWKCEWILIFYLSSIILAVNFCKFIPNDHHEFILNISHTNNYSNLNFQDAYLHQRNRRRADPSKKGPETWSVGPTRWYVGRDWLERNMHIKRPPCTSVLISFLSKAQPLCVRISGAKSWLTASAFLWRNGTPGLM